MEQRELQKYVGRTVEIMYIDRHGKISQRRIEVRSVSEGVVKAYCLTQNGPRIFKIDSILAALLVSRRTG